MKRRHFVRAEEESDDAELAEKQRELREKLRRRNAGSRPHDNAAPPETHRDTRPNTDTAIAQPPAETAEEDASVPAPDSSGVPIESSAGLGDQLAGGPRRLNPLAGADGSGEPARSSVEGSDNSRDTHSSDKPASSESSSEGSASDGSSSDGSSSDEPSSSDRKPSFRRRLVARKDTNIREPDRKAAALALLEQERNSLQPVKEHTVDDTDGLDPAAERAAWRERQLARQRRDQAAEEAVR